MKLTLTALLLTTLLSTACSQQTTKNPTSQQTPVVDTVRGDTSDCNLDNKYTWLQSQGRNVEIVDIDTWFSQGWRGYFAFTENNDVHCDEVIHNGDTVTRFRGGEEEMIDMTEFMNRVVGTRFIADYDER